MKEMIQQRRNSLEKGETFDLFSGLLESADDPADQLTDEELIGTPLSDSLSGPHLIISGNVFIFLVAGHEVRGDICTSGFGLDFISDNGPYPSLHFRAARAVPRRAGEAISAHQIRHRT